MGIHSSFKAINSSLPKAFLTTGSPISLSSLARTFFWFFDVGAFSSTIYSSPHLLNFSHWDAYQFCFFSCFYRADLILQSPAT
jgi:hypothetical protein